MITELAPTGQPLLLFSLHHDRARLALLQRDEAGFAKHIERMQHWCNVTRNATLFARVEALFKQGRRVGSVN